MKLLRKAQPPEITARAVTAIKSLHEDKHVGQQQTIKMARDRYIWPGMGRDIKKFVKSCPVCQPVKINKHEHDRPGSFPSEKT